MHFVGEISQPLLVRDGICRRGHLYPLLIMAILDLWICGFKALSVGGSFSASRFFDWNRPHLNSSTDLKFSNLAEPLLTNKTIQSVEPIHWSLFMSIFNQLSWCHQNSAVLKHSYRAVLHTYQVRWLHKLSPSLPQRVVVRTVGSLRACGSDHDQSSVRVQTTITISVYHAAPPADQEPVIFQRWFKVLQSAW